VSETNWYSTARRKVLIDNHLDDWLPGGYARYDSKTIAQTIIDADFECGMIYARCHVGTCYWNASEGPKHAGLGEHDQIGEICQQLQAAGKHFILYYSVVYDKKLNDGHPDWRMVAEGPDGDSFGRNSRYRQVCPNSPYRAYTMRALEEIARNYPIEGAFLDMTFWPTVCHCPHCQAAWAVASGGKAIPAKNWLDRDWKAFVGWRYGVMTSFIRDCTAALHKYRPGIVVSFQCPNQLHGSWVRGNDLNAADSGAIPSHDVYYPSGHIHMSLQPRLFQATSPIHPFDIFISRPVVGLRDMPAMKPFAHMLAEASSVLANGGAIIYIDQIHPDGTLYQDIWDQFKRLNAEIASREAFTGGQPVPYAGVYFSQDTRDFYGQDDYEGRYMSEFLGACKALLEEHVLFDIITPRNLGELGHYKVIVLPNTACLGPREVEALRQFVAAGGGLVGSYQVSAGNAWNEPYGQPALGDVFGIQVLGDTQKYTDSYFRVAAGDHPVAQGLYRQRPVTCARPQLLIEALDGAEELAHIVYPYVEPAPDHYISIHNNPPGVETSCPAIVAHRFGQGRAVYFASQIGAMYATSSYWEAKRLMANAVRWAAGEAAPVEVEAPLCVEVTAWDQPEQGRRVIHLVNIQSDIGRTLSNKSSMEQGAQENLHVIQEILPVYDLGVRFRLPAGKQVKHISLQPSGIELTPVSEGVWSSVRVPKVHVYEAVVIEEQ
jgi:uncharacterized membrane protein